MNKSVTTSINVEKLNNSYFKGVPNVVTFEYLVQLWRVARQNVTPVSALQFQCEESDIELPELQGITPTAAMINFAIAAKKFTLADPLRDIIDASRREGPVVVSPVSLTTPTINYTVANGYIEKLTNKEASIRQVSDIISTYTSYDHKRKVVTSVFTPESCKAVRVPYLDLINVRSALEVNDLDAIVARNAIYNKLLRNQEYPYFWFYCLQVILHHESMAEYRAPAADPVIQWYTKQTALTPKHRFNKYYEFCSKAIVLYNMTLDQAWVYALKSDALRGTAKKRGVFTVGYYSYPMSPVYVKIISEASDILSVMKLLKLEAVEVIHPNRMLCEVLAYNGMIVKAVTMSVKKMTTRTKGIYGQLNCPYITYRAAPEKPTLDGKSARLPVHLEFSNGELRSEYIRSNLPYCAIYPSMRASDGIIMTYYNSATMSKPGPKTLKAFAENLAEYVERFTRSITWRNNFLFARVSYYFRDPFRSHFTNVVLPPIREDNDPNLFANTLKEQVDISAPVITDKDLGSIALLKVKETVVPEPELTDEIVGLLFEKCGYPEIPKADEDFAEVHHMIYQAYSNSRHARPELMAVLLGNRLIFRKFLLDLERKVLIVGKDPSNNSIVFDYKSYKKKSIPTTEKRVGDIPYETDDDEQEDVPQMEDVNEDLPQASPPVEDDDDDMFKQKVTIEQ